MTIKVNHQDCENNQSLPGSALRMSAAVCLHGMVLKITLHVHNSLSLPQTSTHLQVSPFISPDSSMTDPDSQSVWTRGFLPGYTATF